MNASTHTAAGRLYLIVSQFGKHPKNVLVGQVIRNLVTEKLPDVKTHYEAMRVLVGLLGEVENEVRRYGIDQVYLEYLPRLFKCITANEGASLSQFFSTINPDGAALNNLKLIDVQIRQHDSWLDAIEDEVISETQQKLRDVFDDIKSKDIDKDLKQFILKHLNEIERAFQNYWVSGASGVEDAALKALAKTQTKVGMPKAKTEEKDALTKFLRVIAICAAIFSQTTGAIKNSLEIYELFAESAADISAIENSEKLALPPPDGKTIEEEILP